jgi:putative photosynthetic complex assembly protein
MSGAGGVVLRPRRGSSPHPLALLAAGALLLGVLAGTVLNRPGPDDALGAARRGNVSTVSVDLRFEDMPGGGVAVRRAADGREVAVLAPGTGGFVRATLRGLARDRKRGDLGPEQPFRLSAWTDGGLSLEDRATGRTLDLRAFGPAQVEAFARLLPAPGEEKP